MFDPNSPDTILRMAPRMDAQQLGQMAKQNAKSPNGALWAGFAMAAQKRQQAAQAQQQPQPTVAQQLGFAAPPPQQQPQQPQGGPPPQQQLPEHQGIAQIPAPNMEHMAGGGIVAFSGADDSLVTDPKAKFYQDMFPAAQQAANELGVDPNILLSQWGLETGWGTKMVGANNYGNIKDPSGRGPRARDKEEGSNDAYRAYKSPQEFAADYTGLIKRNFPDAVGAGSDVGKFSAGLANGRTGSYATAPDYSKRLANTLTSLLPMSSANAATAQPPAAAPSQAPQQGYFNGNQSVVGGLEALLNKGTGALATLPAAGYGAIHGITSRLAGSSPSDANQDQNAAFARAMGAMTYQPRTQAGAELSEGVDRTLQDLKIPAYMPEMASLAQRTTPRDVASATARTENPRLAPPETQRLAPPGGGNTAAQLAAQAADREAANATRVAAQNADRMQAADIAQQSAGRLGAVEQQAAISQRAQNAARASGVMGANPSAGAFGAAGAQNPALDAGAAIGAANAKSDTYAGANWPAQNVAPAEAVAKAKELIPPEARKGWSDDMLMMFFLQMMAGQSRNALQNVGQAGMSAMQYGMAAKKADREAMKDEAQAGHYKKHGEYLDRMGTVAMAGDKTDITAYQVRLKDIDEELKSLMLPGGTALPQNKARIDQLKAAKEAIHAKLAAITGDASSPAGGAPGWGVRPIQK